MIKKILVLITVTLSTFLVGCNMTNPLLNLSTMLDNLQNSSISEWKMDEIDFSKYNVSSPVEELGKDDISTSKSVGAVLGGVIAAVYCNKEYGAAVAVACGWGGSVAGAEVGNLVGTGIAIRRFQYATEYEFLESEIEASESAIKTRQQQLDEAERVIAELGNEASSLSASSERTEDEIKKAASIQKEITEKLEEQKVLEERYQDSIAYLNSAIDSSEEKLDEKLDDKEKTQQRLSQLKSNRDNLNVKLAKTRRQTDTMQGILTTVS